METCKSLIRPKFLPRKQLLDGQTFPLLLNSTVIKFQSKRNFRKCPPSLEKPNFCGNGSIAAENWVSSPLQEGEGDLLRPFLHRVEIHLLSVVSARFLLPLTRHQLIRRRRRRNQPRVNQKIEQIYLYTL